MSTAKILVIAAIIVLAVLEVMICKYLVKTKPKNENVLTVAIGVFDIILFTVIMSLV